MTSNCIFVPEESFLDELKRKTIITGHYGSGKTEFAVSLALKFARNENHTDSDNVSLARQWNHPPVSLIDLDIVNPYFRSREQRKLLEENGISVYGSVYKKEIAAELPALGADIKAPLECSNTKVIIDAGGNDTGALILNQFTKYFTDDETTILAVINANRPETSDINGAAEHITAIENITGLTVSYIINNTHMLRETTTEDILSGLELCKTVCKKLDKTLLCSCYPEEIITPDDLRKLQEHEKNLMPLGLYMRPTWLK
ncbi:MAG: ATP-binding protein [Oscillospiraceae bacterium]|nr:ATP-binding protein [Oscillospiraceae bacterium]